MKRPDEIAQWAAVRADDAGTLARYIQQQDAELATLRAKLATAEQQHKRAVELLERAANSLRDFVAPEGFGALDYQRQLMLSIRAHLAANKETKA